MGMHYSNGPKKPISANAPSKSPKEMHGDSMKGQKKYQFEISTSCLSCGSFSEFNMSTVTAEMMKKYSNEFALEVH